MKSEPTKHLIEFPKEGCVYASPDQTILEAALAAGVSLFHVCGGNAKYSTCRVLVIEGAEWLAPPNEKEKHLNNQMHFPRNVRLACQTHISGGPIKLTRIIQDETDIGIYVGVPQEHLHANWRRKRAGFILSRHKRLHTTYRKTASF